MEAVVGFVKFANKLVAAFVDREFDPNPGVEGAFTKELVDGAVEPNMELEVEVPKLVLAPNPVALVGPVEPKTGAELGAVVKVEEGPNDEVFFPKGLPDPKVLDPNPPTDVVAPNAGVDPIAGLPALEENEKVDMYIYDGLKRVKEK